MYGLSTLILPIIQLFNVLENKRRDKMQARSGTMCLTAEDKQAKFLDFTDFERHYF